MVDSPFHSSAELEKTDKPRMESASQETLLPEYLPCSTRKGSINFASTFSLDLEKAVNGKGLWDTESQETLVETTEADFTDGGLRAWLVVAGICCTTFATLGLVNSWGVFQAYYETHNLKGSSSFDIACIGSMQLALIYLPGVIVGRLFDLGWLKLPFALGSTGLVLSTFLIAQCTEYWHFLLVQGVLIGISCAVCYGPTTGLIGHWFKRRRGIAVTIAAAGSSLGSAVIPIIVRQLLPKVGFPWTMRTIGVIVTLFMGIANVTLERRLPPQNTPGGLFNFGAFKSPAFTLYCLASLFAFLGVYTLPSFIGVSAQAVGIPEDFSFYLISIRGAFSGIGRLATGYIVDKLGPVNVSVPMTMTMVLLTFLWPLAHTQSSLIAIAALYGLTSGTYIATFQMPAYSLGKIEDVGRRAGMMMTFAAFGAIAGPPISGALHQVTGGFVTVSYYAGSVMLLSCILSLLTRHMVLRKLLGYF